MSEHWQRVVIQRRKTLRQRLAFWRGLSAWETYIVFDPPFTLEATREAFTLTKPRDFAGVGPHLLTADFKEWTAQ